MSKGRRREGTPSLHVILAAAAPVAVVIRQETYNPTRLSLWHTDTDELEHGQWVAHAIEPRSCALSPDGRLFCWTGHSADADEPGWFTGLSRPPYFTALHFWDREQKTRGGSFESARELLLHQADSDELPLPTDLPLTVRRANVRIEHRRLLELGWRQHQPGSGTPWYSRRRRNARLQLHIDRTGEPHYGLGVGQGHWSLPVHWADWDQQGRLVYTGWNSLCTAQIDATAGLANARAVGEFGPMEFENVEAPDWAREW